MASVKYTYLASPLVLTLTNEGLASLRFPSTLCSPYELHIVLVHTMNSTAHTKSRRASERSAVPILISGSSIAPHETSIDRLALTEEQRYRRHTEHQAARASAEISERSSV